MVSLDVVVGPPARAGFQGVSVVMMAWSWRSRLQAMATRAWLAVSLFVVRVVRWS